jgi:nicotinic acetylcholine receptor
LQVLLIELVPPNSVTTPLLGEYLLFTFIVVSISVSTQVIVLNIDFRTCSNYTMSSFTRLVFLDILPKVSIPQLHYAAH